MREVEATLKVDVRCHRGSRERESLGLTTLSMEDTAADRPQRLPIDPWYNLAASALASELTVSPVRCG